MLDAAPLYEYPELPRIVQTSSGPILVYPDAAPRASSSSVKGTNTRLPWTLRLGQCDFTSPATAAEMTKRSHGGKRRPKNQNSAAPGRESKNDQDANGDGDEYVAYASDGSEAADVARSDSDDHEDSDEDIALGPVDESKRNDEDRMSDVEVSFEFFDPVATDARTVSLLLNDYSKECDLDARAIASEIVAQSRVGTCVKITDEQEPVGFISCLNVHKHSALLSGLLSKVQSVGREGEKGSMADMVSRGFREADQASSRMGLVLFERVVNLPPVLAAKMLEAVFCEVEWAIEDEPEEAERDRFKFRWLLYVTEAYCSERDPKAPVSKRRRKEGRNAEDVVFTRPEDEVWMDAAVDVATWTLEGEKPGAQGLTRMRMAMVVPAEKTSTLLKNVFSLVGLKEDGAHEDHTTEAPSEP